MTSPSFSFPMRQNQGGVNHIIICQVLVIVILVIFAQESPAETLYVDSKKGDNANPGTSNMPLRTLAQAATLINNDTNKIAMTIKVAPGIYCLTETVLLKNRFFTQDQRLVIEAAILPDDPQWQPLLMPVIVSMEDPKDPEKPNKSTETYGFKIQTSHVTLRGLKFMGNPSMNNWHCPVEHVGQNLEDLVVTQCLFVGDKETFDIYCPVITNGNGLVVDHCIFVGCHASVVFWDGREGHTGSGHAMRYCIVNGGHIAGVWTCQTAEDFEFHHNIVSDCRYFWLRKRSEPPRTYRLSDCIVTDIQYYSGYGLDSGPTGQTGPEITYNESNIVKKGKVVLESDKNARNYLHVVPGTLGGNLGSGLFKKSK